MTDLLNDKDNIDFAKKQIEYTNAYGNYLAVNDKHLAIQKEITAKHLDIAKIKSQIVETEDYIKNQKNILQTLNSDKKELTNKLIDFKSKMGEVDMLSKTLYELETKINNLADKGNAVDKQINDVNSLLRSKKDELDSLYLDLDEYNNIYKHYNKIVDKLNDTADKLDNLSDSLKKLNDSLNK